MPSTSPKQIIPFSYMHKTSKKLIDGIVKDPHNHIIAVSFLINDQHDTHVAVPIIDDGALSILTSFSISYIYLNWESFNAASVDDTIAYYNQNIIPYFVMYSGYQIESMIRDMSTKKIVALQLKNNLYVPVEPTDEASIQTQGIPIVEKEEYIWEIEQKMEGITSIDISNVKKWGSITQAITDNKQCGENTHILKKYDNTEYDELYQQFRYMVANFIEREEELKQNI
jgi:hypothetical protein